MHHFIFESTAKQKGTLFSYQELKKGNFVEANVSEKARLMTTMITDIPEVLWDFCQKLSTNVQRKVIQPNGFTSATFIFEYYSDDFEIKITRELRDWWMFFLFSYYAELPTSYKIILEVKTHADEIASKIENFLLNFTKDRQVSIR